MTVHNVHHWFGRSRRELIDQLRSLADDLEALGRSGFAPKSYVFLDNWGLGERTVPCLAGCFIGHPNIGDGRPGFISEVFFVDDQHKTARTLSRWYLLGDHADFAGPTKPSRRQ